MVVRVVTKPAPKTLCVYSDAHRANTLSYLGYIEHQVLVERKNILVDLSEVEMVTAAASLLLFSYVNRAHLLTGSIATIGFIFPKQSDNEEGHRWVVKTGLSRALKSGTLDKLDSLVIDQQFFQSSATPEIHLFTTIEMLQERAQLDYEQFSLLTSAISEAMLNVKHHAYLSDRFAEFVSLLGQRWWQCAWFDSERNSIVFIIYDFGLGVYESYTGSRSFNAGTQDQNSSVQEAFQQGRSRLGWSGRGNGSQDIKRPVFEANSGCYEELLVYTGNVRYEYTSDHSEQVREVVRASEYMPGTLIQWELCL
ncbi:hypothetical protein AB4497_12045 [Vibrio cyclitrophicus]